MPSRGLKNYFFTMKFFSQDLLYVNNICARFQGQKIYTKKDIQNLPTCVAVRKISLLPTLTPSQRLRKNIWSMKFLSWDHLYVDNMCAKFQVQKSHPKKGIWNLSKCVVVRKNFTTTHVGRFQISFLWVNLLDLKFGTHMIGYLMTKISWTNFFFQSLGGCQSWKQSHNYTCW